VAAAPGALTALAWPEVAGVAGGAILAVPLGSTEQHGPHLPLGTDSDVAVALAERLAAARADVLVAPVLPYGSAGEHAAFPGTLSIGAAALELVVVELVRSASAFAGVVLVSGHGGNAVPLAAAVATLRAEGRAVLAWSPRIPGGDAHAGRTETSLVLALAPGTVRLEAAERGDVRPLAAVIGRLRRSGVAAVSPNGVLGDPRSASAAEGRRLLDDLTADLVAAVEAWRP
jgi:mycofactocin precursor peptide peptidase